MKVERPRLRPLLVALATLAVLLPERYRAMPEVPTLTEAGYPAVDIVPWGGFVVPAGTPRDMAEVAARELREVMTNPDLIAQCDKVGLQVRSSSAEQFTALLTDTQRRHALERADGGRLEAFQWPQCAAIQRAMYDRLLEGRDP